MTMIVIPRPALAGPGPSQAATAVGAGGIGGGTEAILRITAWDCEVADEGSSKLTFTLAMPPPGKAPTPPTLYFPQLIAQLQQDAGNTATAAATVPPATGGGTGIGSISLVTSTDATVSVTNPSGPTVNLSRSDVDAPTSTLIGQTLGSFLLNTALGHNAAGLTTVGATNPSGGSNTAIGQSAAFFDTNSSNTAVGAGSMPASAHGFQNTAIGSGAGYQQNDSNLGTFVGFHTSSYADNTVTIGANAVTGGGTGSTGSVAIGSGAQGHVNSVTSSEPTTLHGHAIAIGQGAFAYYDNDIAIGYQAVCHDEHVTQWGESIAIGYSASTFDYWSISIGYNASSGNATVRSVGAIAIGKGAKVDAEQAIAIGVDSLIVNNAATTAIAIGNNATAGDVSVGYGAVAVGLNSWARGDYSTAVGASAHAATTSDTAIGNYAEATGGYATAIGGWTAPVPVPVALTYGVSLGNAGSQVAIGPCTTAQFPTYQGAGLFLPKATASPGAHSTNGGTVYVSSAGALTFQGAAGTITTIAPP